MVFVPIIPILFDFISDIFLITGSITLNIKYLSPTLFLILFKAIDEAVLQAMIIALHFFFN